MQIQALSTLHIQYIKTCFIYLFIFSLESSTCVRSSLYLRKQGMGLTCWQTPCLWLCVCLFHSSIQHCVFAFIAGSFSVWNLMTQLGPFPATSRHAKKKTLLWNHKLYHSWIFTPLLYVEGQLESKENEFTDIRSPTRKKWRAHSYKTQIYCCWMYKRTLPYFPVTFTT